MFRKPYRGYYLRRRLLIAGVVASGAISGTAALSIGQSAQLTGTGSLAGTSTLTVAQSAQLTGSGSLTGTSTLTIGQSAQLTAAGGAITGTATLTIGESAQITGTGALVSAQTVSASGVNFVAQVSPEPVDEDYGELTTLPNGFGDGEFTFQVWVKADDSYPTGPVRGGSADTFDNWSNETTGLGNPSDPIGNFLIDGHNNSNGTNGTFSLQVVRSGLVGLTFGDGNAYNYLENASGDNILDGNWHLITVVRRWSGASDSDIELWVDSTQQDTTALTGRPNMATSYWDSWTGYPAGEDGWFFGSEKQAANNDIAHYEDYKGVVSNIAFWSDARTSGEISSDYSAGVNSLVGNEANLVGLYRCDEGTGTTASDELASGGDITFYLGPTTATAPDWVTFGGSITFDSSAQLTAAGGAMTGTATLAFSESAQLTADGTLAGTSLLTIGESAQLTANGALTGTSLLTVSESAQLSATGALVGSSTLSFSESAQLTVGGNLGGTASLSVGQSAQLTGNGALTGVSTIVFSLSTSVVFSGWGDIVNVDVTWTDTTDNIPTWTDTTDTTQVWTKVS